MMNRAAVRCLLDAQSGLLSVLDRATGRVVSRAVRYEPMRDGTFTAYVSDSEDLADVISGGGAVSLEIDRAPTAEAPGVDEPGAVDADAVAQVTAHMDADVLETSKARLGRSSLTLAKLRLKIRDIAVALRQPAAA